MIFNLTLAMRKIIYLICLLYSTAALGQDLYLPKVNIGDDIINHKNYSLLYNEKYEQASWIAYELTSYETIKKFKRTNRFGEDPRVQKNTPPFYKSQLISELAFVFIHFPFNLILFPVRAVRRIRNVFAI